MSEFIYAVKGAKYWKDLEATQEAQEGDLVARVTHPGTEKCDLVQPSVPLRPTMKKGGLFFSDGTEMHSTDLPI